MSDVEWLHVERRTGTLPPGVLESRVTGKILGEVGEIVTESERLEVRNGLPDLLDVEVAVADGLSIVGSIPLLLPADRPGPARVRYNRPKPGFILEAWLDLMVLMALDPETPWRSVSICRGGKNGEPATVIELEPRLGGALGGMRARQALEVVAHCYRSGMCEPLPLFPPSPSRWSTARARPGMAPSGGVGRRRQGCHRLLLRPPHDAGGSGVARRGEGPGRPAADGWIAGPPFSGARSRRRWGRCRRDAPVHVPIDIYGPLPTGRVAIEASAGTGKTFTLAVLATRVPRRTGHLSCRPADRHVHPGGHRRVRSRIRRQMVEAAAALGARASLCRGRRDLIDHLASRDRDIRRARLERAVSEFDSASISTIHGFATQVRRT